MGRYSRYAATADVVTRINSGGLAVNVGGKAWTADRYFTGGDVAISTEPIAGTTDDVLYQTQRVGDVSYAIPVPTTGTYTVRLHFAELYFGAPGDASHLPDAGWRQFGFNLEGGAVELDDYEANAEVGPLTADTRAYAVQVTDGTLDIDALPDQHEPIINAIEVLVGNQLPPASDVVTRINSGGLAVNVGGKAWTADRYFTGGDVAISTEPIAGTTDDVLYQTQRVGDVSYAIPGPHHRLVSSSHPLCRTTSLHTHL